MNNEQARAEPQPEGRTLSFDSSALSRASARQFHTLMLLRDRRSFLSLNAKFPLKSCYMQRKSKITTMRLMTNTHHHIVGIRNFSFKLKLSPLVIALI